MANRNNQSGSIRTFFIIGIVLTCVLVGSLFYIKNRGEDARIAENSSKNETKTTETVKNQTTKDDTSNKPKADQESTAATNESAATLEETDTENLPTTGPESVISEMTAIFILTAVGTSIVRSRINKFAYSTQKNDDASL